MKNHKHKVRKVMVVMIGVVIIIYAILWIFSFKQYDVEMGISYSPDYTRSLGLDHDETFEAILSDHSPSTIRLAVPWSDVEKVQGTFDFSEIDTMIRKAGEIGTKVVLTVGQKVPRWPECYIPTWADSLDADSKKIALLNYVKTTVNRYKNNSTIELWQAENEPYIRFSFGHCDSFDQDVVKDEIALIKKLDPSRDIVVTDSGELSSFRRPALAGDVLGTTLYRSIRLNNGWVFNYDWLPPAFYKLKARMWEKDYNHFYVSELQAEPWFVGASREFNDEKTFSPERFTENVEYAKKIGASRVYLWGAEWWYLMKKQGDARYVEKAKEIFSNTR